MADAEKIANLEKSIADWEARMSSGSGSFSPAMMEEIVGKLKADLEAAKAE